MTNNYKKIKDLMVFENIGDFYYVTVMKRKKDAIAGEWHTDCNNIVVCDYYIKSFDDFEKNFFDIKRICDALNGRAYIYLNKRNFEKIAKETMKKIVNNVANGDYEACKSSYNKCCGKHSTTSKKYKTWLFDFDYDEHDMEFEEFFDLLSKELKNVRPFNENTVICSLKTKLGYHIITTPFDLQQFYNKTELKIEKSDFKKNSPTLLYYGG